MAKRNSFRTSGTSGPKRGPRAIHSQTALKTLAVTFLQMQSYKRLVKPVPRVFPGRRDIYPSLGKALKFLDCRPHPEASTSRMQRIRADDPGPKSSEATPSTNQRELPKAVQSEIKTLGPRRLPFKLGTIRKSERQGRYLKPKWPHKCEAQTLV